ncbi:hypothetical protein K41_22370, partial [Klebsiella pneumoniae]
NISCKPTSDILTYLAQCFARYLHLTDIRIEDGAIGVDPVTSITGATVLTCRGSQFWMVPNSDH